MKVPIYFAALFACAALRGQQLMTFDDCLRRAMAENLELKSAGFDEKIAATKHLASYGKLLPNVSGEVRSIDSNGDEINSHNLFENADEKEWRGTLSADFNLFSGFSTLRVALSTLSFLPFKARALSGARYGVKKGCRCHRSRVPQAGSVPSG